MIKTRENLSLYTEAIGNKKNKACLLIAGAGASCRFWTDSFCQSLQENGFFVIRYDHRDVGLSSSVDFTEKPYDLEDLALDVLDILDFYQMESSHIIAHSMGGFVAQWLAATSPQRVAKMVILASGPIGKVLNYQFELSPSQKDLNDDVWRICRSNHPSKDFDESIEGFLTIWRLLNGTYDLDEKMARNYTRDLYDRSNHLPGFHPSFVAVIEKTLALLGERSSLLTAIKAPTLVIHGKEDLLLMPQITGIPLAMGISDAELQLIPKMGHMLFNQELEESLESRILTFLAGAS